MGHWGSKQLAKRIKRSAEWYRAAMLGVSDKRGEVSPGLRSVASGFRAADGFNLRALREGKWTPAQKRKVSMYFSELQQLTAQEKVVIKTRSKDRLQKAQAIGGHDPRYKFKVAFVPGTKDTTVVWNADNTPTMRGANYSLNPVLFDPENLAVDPKGEVKRVLSDPKLNGSNAFGILTGPNVMLGGIPDRKLLARKITMLMAKYDGKSPLPETSGNKHGKNANPANHHYAKWLFGIQGMQFDKRKDFGKVITKITQANKALQRRRKNAKRRDEYKKGK